MMIIWLARFLALFALACLAALGQELQSVTARRAESLEVLTSVLQRTSTKITGRITAQDDSWEDWVKRTGELPPDFDAMPSIAELPNPLVFIENGRKMPITTPEQWERQRRWIRSQFEQWIFGKMPPAPSNLRATVTAKRREGHVTVEDVLLEFGHGHRAKLRLQLMIPPGDGPFPVFLTNHPRTRPWVATAVRRGYIGCIYYAADPRYGNTDDSDKFIEVYPEYDFSCLARWAWAGMRAVDYLYTLPVVDKEKIAITGHSRNGKQALLAAAFDERIGAVAPSSGNTGESDPWRYTTDMFRNETIEQITGNFPHWFHPRLRFFAGREHKLPVDQNSLMALVAPRGLLLASAYSENQGNPWGFEQAYRSARNVYRFLGAEKKLGLYLRPGEHPTTAEDIERYVDFFDAVFGRKEFPKQEDWINAYSFAKWRKLSGESIDPMEYPSRELGWALKNWDENAAAARKNVLWVLGDEPSGVRFPTPRELPARPLTSDGWLAALYGRPFESKLMRSAPLAFGDDLKADLYYPAGPDGKPSAPKMPVVVWLHPYAYPTGYSRYTRPVFESLAQKGLAVLAFDQIGFGTRVLSVRRFYERYPHWSLLGKMVTDTRAAIEALAELETIDSSRIYLVGYALGAKVGLFTAALDDRVAAVAAVAGFTPLRLDAADKGTEGLRHYSHLHGLLPRLGFFIGHQDRVPFDYEELLALIAPRPVCVVAPKLDRYATHADVRQAVEAARSVYTRMNRPDALVLDSPVDFNRFPRAMQERVFEWLQGLQ